MEMKKLINPYLEKQGYNCFGCSPKNPIGLHLEFWEDINRIYKDLFIDNGEHLADGSIHRQG